MNGVCVTFIGWIDTQRLDGAAYLDLDAERGKVARKRYQSVTILCSGSELVNNQGYQLTMYMWAHLGYFILVAG